MKTDGAHSWHPTQPRKRKAPESSQALARTASPQGGQVDGLGEPARGSDSTSCHPSGKKRKSESKSSTSFSDLPAALQAKICSHLEGSPYQTVRDMTTFRSTSRVQSEILRQEGYPWPLFQELRTLVRAVRQLFREEEARLAPFREKVEFANRELRVRFADHATAFGPALGVLSPGERGALVRLVGDLPDEDKRSKAIKSLGRELAHLEAPQRESLVNAAFRLTDCEFKANAITGLVASLEHLDPSQRDNLVAALIALPINSHKARAIRILGPKLAFLDETQCAKLAQSAADLTNLSYDKAFFGLFKGLAGLDPARRKMIIDPAMESLDRAGGRVQASIALLPGVEYLSESQREQIIASARTTLHLGGDHQLGSIIGLVAPAINHMGKPYLDAMFNRAINAQQGKALALYGLGMCIAHLDEAQREALLRAAGSLPSDRERAWAIDGMAAGVVHLSDDGRNTLMAEVKRLKDDHARNLAIRFLGENGSLQHLSPAHRQDLIAAATSGGSIIGLAKSLRHLTQPERELLLMAAERLKNPHDRVAVTAALAKATAEALLLREPDMRAQ